MWLADWLFGCRLITTTTAMIIHNKLGLLANNEAGRVIHYFAFWWHKIINAHTSITKVDNCSFKTNVHLIFLRVFCFCSFQFSCGIWKWCGCFCCRFYFNVTLVFILIYSAAASFENLIILWRFEKVTETAETNQPKWPVA